jgi:butyryl-CoA dehydrogenase
MSLIVDRRDLDFVLFELLEAEKLLERRGLAEFDRDTIRQILDSAQQLAEQEFLPRAAEVDANEPVFADGKVRMPEGTGRALNAFGEAGFFSLPFPNEIGGLGAPWFLQTAVIGMFACASTSITNYAFLTIAAANLLNAFGSDHLKRTFLAPMLQGRWFGTMCLSEPQAGSSVGDITTTAMPNPDGSHRIRGAKMWISGGDHDISDNIVHMVLARVPGGPAGTKGISLFLVPKRLVDDHGNPGRLNNIALAGLNHKMGQRGTTNCLLNFGEGGDCLGYLIGEPHRGIEHMFHMMNEARIGVGHASVMAALGGYLYAARYAQTRLQGRGDGAKDPAPPQVPIIEHSDIKRMLLAQKAAVEGAQALSLYCATLVDQLALEQDAEARGDLSSLLGLLTPVAKSWPSEHCLEANKWAIQVLGGYGYTKDYPVERLYRDNRLNHIHEGTFGIQGLDLLGRKVAGDGGETLRRFAGLVRQAPEAASGHERLREYAAALSDAIDHLLTTSQALLELDDRARRLANATTYLDAFGHVVIAWIWLRQAVVAAGALSASGLTTDDRRFYEGKILTCQYFFRHELPLARTRLALCASLDTTALDAPAAMFASSDQN